MCKFLIIFKVLNHIKKDEKITNYDNDKLKNEKIIIIIIIMFKVKKMQYKV